jgi:hypothetical protein
VLKIQAFKTLFYFFIFVFKRGNQVVAIYADFRQTNVRAGHPDSASAEIRSTAAFRSFFVARSVKASSSSFSLDRHELNLLLARGGLGHNAGP